MKKFTKVLTAAAIISALCVVPAFAQEVTDPKSVVTEAQLNQTLAAHQAVVQGQVDYICNSMADKDAAARHAAVVADQVKKYNRSEAANYIDYLKKVNVNLKETERIKKEVVDNYTNLSKVNPSYAAVIPQAQNDYNKAVADRLQNEANIAKAAADFAVMY